jgi:methionyl-tRNA formyltransferase
MKFSMLITNNNRSKAYLQNLIKNNFLPSKIIVLNTNNLSLVEHTENDKLISKFSDQIFIRKLDDLSIFFNEKEHVLKTIQNHKIEFVEINNLDVNSKEVIDEVEKIEDNYIIYSGPSSSILKKENIIKKTKNLYMSILGWLPKFRGSTTIYYSMLSTCKIGCSIIILDEGIDKGPVLYREEYEILEKGIDFDYLVDPLVRSKTLIEFLKRKEN